MITSLENALFYLIDTRVRSKIVKWNKKHVEKKTKKCLSLSLSLAWKQVRDKKTELINTSLNMFLNENTHTELPLH